MIRTRITARYQPPWLWRCNSSIPEPSALNGGQRLGSDPDRFTAGETATDARR
jgi:hypothetical protein